MTANWWFTTTKKGFCNAFEKPTVCTGCPAELSHTDLFTCNHLIMFGESSELHVSVLFRNYLLHWNYWQPFIQQPFVGMRIWFHIIWLYVLYCSFSSSIRLFSYHFLFSQLPTQPRRAAPWRCLSPLTSHLIPSGPISSLLICSSNHKHHTHTRTHKNTPNRTPTTPDADPWTVWSGER